jgi:predicted SAM-dependent methyltransferase
MDSLFSRISFRRPIMSYHKVRSLVSFCLRNREIFLDRERIAHTPYLDIGCGSNVGPGCLNLDYVWQPGVDLCWDVTRGLPLADASLRGIYTEHCLEHLPMPAMFDLLRECRRVLQPSGLLRIVVPDGEIYLSRYVETLAGAASAPLPYAESDRFRGRYTPMLSVNRIFRDHGHQFIYDFATMRLLLEEADFANITKQGFRQGADPVLLRDTADREIESLYVEATKPTA